MLPTIIRRKNYASPSIFDDFLTDSFSPNANYWNGSHQKSNSPAVNVEETDKDYRIELAAPGLSKEDMNISVKDGELTISSEKKVENKEEKNNYIRQEFAYNTFTKAFSLPEETDAEKVSAKYKNGVLTVIVPKAEVQVQPTKEIKIS